MHLKLLSLLWSHCYRSLRWIASRSKNKNKKNGILFCSFKYYICYHNCYEYEIISQTEHICDTRMSRTEESRANAFMKWYCSIAFKKIAFTSTQIVSRWRAKNENYSFCGHQLTTLQWFNWCFFPQIILVYYIGILYTIAKTKKCEKSVGNETKACWLVWKSDIELDNLKFIEIRTKKIKN